MTFRIDRTLVAVFAIAFVCASGASAKADAGSGDGKNQAGSANHKHHGHAKRQPQQYATVSRDAPRPQPQYREVPWQPFGWGGPPLQDSRDAYHGYFANPVDDPRYYGTGRTTQIFR
jgi:hypothetical protein